MFRHDALLYADADEFVAGTAAFVRDGLAAGEPVLVAVVEPNRSRLREELGPDVGRVEFLDLAQLGRNPARLLPAWQDRLDRLAPAGTGLRGVSEPGRVGRTRAESVECQLHEQLLNTAFANGPGWWLLCPYDTAALSEDVIKDALDAHPGPVAPLAGDDSRPEPSAIALFAGALPEPGHYLYRAQFGRTDLGSLRHSLSAHATDLGARTADLVLAVNELACNSVLYGSGTGTVSLWHEDGNVVCEVHDQGVITDPLVGRRRPAGAVTGGAGLWMVNQLCDLVQIRSAPGTGTTVRVSMALPDA